MHSRASLGALGTGALGNRETATQVFMATDNKPSQDGGVSSNVFKSEPQPRTLSERLRISLADDIISGRLPPGTSLDEVELANRFQVSRTPVREALRQLSASGLVVHRAHRGAVVMEASDTDLDHMFEVLTDLEALCAFYATTRMTADERRQLEAVHTAGEAIVRAGDEDAYGRHNMKLHGLIYTGTHNPFLVEMLRAAKARTAPFRVLQFRSAGRIAASHAEHQKIVDAIHQGEATRASELMRIHIRHVRESIAAMRTELSSDAP